MDQPTAALCDRVQERRDTMQKTFKDKNVTLKIEPCNSSRNLRKLIRFPWRSETTATTAYLYRYLLISDDTSAQRSKSTVTWPCRNSPAAAVTAPYVSPNNELIQRR